MTSVLKQFLHEEVSYALDPILNAIRKHKENPHKYQMKLGFNRFDITLFFEDNSVLIEDDLDPSPSGEQRLSLDEFLQHHTQR